MTKQTDFIEGLAINPKAMEALKNHQRQLDMDGVEVGVSRQALDELITAYESTARHIAPLVEALDYWYKRYADEDGEAMLQDDPLGDCADKGKQALANLPEELKLK